MGLIIVVFESGDMRATYRRGRSSPSYTTWTLDQVSLINIKKEADPKTGLSTNMGVGVPILRDKRKVR